MIQRTDKNGLQVAAELVEFIEGAALPGTASVLCAASTRGKPPAAGVGLRGTGTAVITAPAGWWGGRERLTHKDGAAHCCWTIGLSEVVLV